MSDETKAGTRWWCWHRWTRWQDATYIHSPHLGRPAEVTMQERRCIKCKRLRVRRVTDE